MCSPIPTRRPTRYSRPPPARKVDFAASSLIRPVDSIASVTTAPRAPVIEPDTDDETDLDDVWKVVVWNDPVNLISYVAWVLRKLFGHSKEKAMELTMQVHNEGRAIVSDGPREQAEMDCYRLHQHGLWATIET